ncbi:hypothetical protein D9613_011882 [Agrocybe pediades]|uniref:Major facilitator superfamily (MFS) profile domain-containing protein n=1 Tax=Agrocybe pediades TaxID=84607 RepID=A0A8H4QKU5_9AGAR|nr:hypothetical protein D9613_011882 [Agrocybe pediades]
MRVIRMGYHHRGLNFGLTTNFCHPQGTSTAAPVYNMRPEETDNETATAGTVLHTTSLDVYPLGKWKAWSTVFGAFLIQMSAWGPVLSFGVFQDFYTRSFLPSFSASNITWIGSVQLFLGLSLGFVGGKLSDAGHGRKTMLAGSALFTFSFFMLSLAKEDKYYQIFLSQGIGFGCGLTLVYIPSFALVSHHFKNRRALAMGLLAANSPFGGVIYSIMLNQLIHSKTGFGWGIRASAFLSLGCSVCGHLLIFIVPRSSIPRKPQAASPSRRMEFLTDPTYLLTLVSGFLGQIGTFFPLFYIQLFAEKHNMSPSLSFYAVAIMHVAGIFGRILPNHLADRYGAMESFIVCSAFCGFIGFAMLGCGTAAGLVLFCIFYGFFFHSTISLYLPVIAALTPAQADMGASFGIAVGPVGVASLIGSPITGAIVGKELAWWKGITFASVCMVASFVVEAFARYLYRRRETVPVKS